MKEISIDEFSRMEEGSYELVDVRDEGLTAYGMIPGAMHIDLEDLMDGNSEKVEAIEAVPKEKKLILYCEVGRRTRDLDDLACLQGRDCYSLEGGYMGYIRSGLADEKAREEKSPQNQCLRNFPTFVRRLGSFGSLPAV